MGLKETLTQSGIETDIVDSIVGKLYEEYTLLPRTLTYENGAKGEFMGEYSIGVEVYDESLEDYIVENHPIPWTTFKQMFKDVVEFFENE